MRFRERETVKPVLKLKKNAWAGYKVLSFLLIIIPSGRDEMYFTPTGRPARTAPVSTGPANTEHVTKEVVNVTAKEPTGRCKIKTLSCFQ